MEGDREGGGGAQSLGTPEDVSPRYQKAASVRALLLTVGKLLRSIALNLL